jgi:hypothetical protein
MMAMVRAYSNSKCYDMHLPASKHLETASIFPILPVNVCF